MNNSTNFDSTKFRLGVLCRRGHDWNETGCSLRYISTNQCRECHKAWSAEYRPSYYQENQERLRQKARDYHHENRETILPRLREYGRTDAYKLSRKKSRQKHLDKRLECTRQWRRNNPERVSAYNQMHYQENLGYHKNRHKKYRAENLDKISEREKQRRLQNRDALAARDKAYRQTNHGKLVRLLIQRQREARKRGTNVPYTVADIESRFNQFKNQCAYCGSNEKITIDHVLAISKNGKDCISNIVPACRDCNTRKRASEVEKWYAQQTFFDKDRWALIQQLITF